MDYLSTYTRFKYSKYLIQIATTLLYFSISQLANALDVVKIGAPQSEKDQRFAYPVELLTKTLDITKDTFGPYKIETSFAMSRDRALLELQKGELINVHEAPTQQIWEDKTLPIYIPIRKGLLGYRIFLIHQDSKSIFSNAQTIDDIKSLVSGLGVQWSITKSMRSLDFTVNVSSDYENIFNLLQLKRIDYYPRGVNEVFIEFEMRKDLYPDLIIEQDKAMYIPLPTFFFVSPTTPRLAKRIEKGLLLMIDNGSFDRLFNKFFAEIITLAKLDKREIFNVNNPLIPQNDIYDKKELWYK